MARNDEKYPDIWDQFQKLIAEQEAIESQTAPLRKERDGLLVEMQPIQEKVKGLTARIKEIQGTRYIEVLNQKAALAKAMGGRQMSQPPVQEEPATV